MVAPHVQARNANRAGLLFAQKSCLNDNSARHSTAIEQRRELFLFFGFHKSFLNLSSFFPRMV